MINQESDFLAAIIFFSVVIDWSVIACNNIQQSNWTSWICRVKSGGIEDVVLMLLSLTLNIFHNF